MRARSRPFTFSMRSRRRTHDAIGQVLRRAVRVGAQNEHVGCMRSDRTMIAGRLCWKRLQNETGSGHQAPVLPALTRRRRHRIHQVDSDRIEESFFCEGFRGGASIATPVRSARSSGWPRPLPASKDQDFTWPTKIRCRSSWCATWKRPRAATGGQVTAHGVEREVKVLANGASGVRICRMRIARGEPAAQGGGMTLAGRAPCVIGRSPVASITLFKVITIGRMMTARVTGGGYTDTGVSQPVMGAALPRSTGPALF